MGYYLGRRLRALPPLARLLVVAVAIGAIAGLGAILLYEALRLASDLFLARLAG